MKESYIPQHEGESGYRILRPPTLCSECVSTQASFSNYMCYGPQPWDLLLILGYCVPETVGRRIHVDNIFLPLTEIFVSLLPPLITLSSTMGSLLVPFLPVISHLAGVLLKEKHECFCPCQAE